VTIAAPCKVNLTLDVFPPRPDGFHDLESVVATFSPADVLTIEAVPALPDGESGVRLSCSDPALPTGDGNLAYRAATSFLAAFPAAAPAALRIALEKHLPFEAGLGGGSSDAAAVLRGLRALTDVPSSDAELLVVAASLGSDVSLFLYDGPVRMWGRGERVEPLDAPLPPLYGVLVKPAVGVPTGPAYRLLDALPDRKPGRATERLLDVLRSDAPTPEAIGAALGNDFEAAVLPAFPEVAEAHVAVAEAGAVRALLCGSGSCIFGLARDGDHARELTDALTGRFPWVHLAKPFVRSAA
jgi:4-diphosphocytidyl-2C-methyl-D-erythritol kinase